MNPRIQELRNHLNAVASAESENDLKLLDETLTAIFQEGFESQFVADLLHVFERFPNQDGFGVFWTILHGIESVPGFEGALLDSVEKSPSEFTVRMINRLINAGEDRIGTTNLMQVLRSVAERGDIPSSVSQEASDFLSFQENKKGEHVVGGNGV